MILSCSSTNQYYLMFHNQYNSTNLNQIKANPTGWPKKGIPLFEVSVGTKVLEKQLNRHIFGFPTKNMAISDKNFQRYHCQKKNICNSAVFCPTALLQISFVEILLRLPVDTISLIENRISHHNQYFQGSSYIHLSNQL